jgi:hypothetical protein
MHRISDIIIFRNIWIFVILAVKDILYALQKGIYALKEFEELSTICTVPRYPVRAVRDDWIALSAATTFGRIVSIYYVYCQ